MLNSSLRRFSTRSPPLWLAASASSCVGFGAFTVKQRNARIGRNPRTGETVQVGEKTKPSFKAGKEMLGRLNRGSRLASEHPT